MFFIVVEVVQMSTITTPKKTVEVLQVLFAKYGLPEQLVSDNGPRFTSEDFAYFMKANGIKHIRSGPNIYYQIALPRHSCRLSKEL